MISWPKIIKIKPPHVSTSCQKFNFQLFQKKNVSAATSLHRVASYVVIWHNKATSRGHFWKMWGYRNWLFHNFGKLEHRQIGFAFKFQVGYLETHFFTTLGGGVKHGIKISFQIMNFQIPFFFDELRHYTLFEKCVGTETHFFIILGN